MRAGPDVAENDAERAEREGRGASGLAVFVVHRRHTLTPCSDRAKTARVVGAGTQSGLKRRSRSEFVTTNALEKAIAAPAITGDKRPDIASGIAATL